MMKENIAVIITKVKNQFNSILLYCVYNNKHTHYFCALYLIFHSEHSGFHNDLQGLPIIKTVCCMRVYPEVPRLS